MSSPPPPPPPPGGPDPRSGGGQQAQAPGWGQAPQAAGPVRPARWPGYAEWIQRVAALLIDSAIVFVAFVVPYFSLVFLGGFINILAQGAPGAALIGFAMTLTGMALAVGTLIGVWIWNYGIRQGRTGQTVGKQLLSIRVVRLDGAPLDVGLSIGRTLLASVLTSATCYINALWPLWDERAQALHDKVVSTVVVKVPPAPLRPPGALVR